MMSLRLLLLPSLLLPSLAFGHAIHNLDKRQSVVPVGTIVTACNQPGVVAVTFDDGPFIFTDELLNIMAAGGQRVTFFVNGQNFGNIQDFAPTVQRMVAEGHQVGSHTFSHPDLATLDANGVRNEMVQLETELSTIIGMFPTYMRPPFFSAGGVALQTLGELGYAVINADVDTKDFENASVDGINNVAFPNFQTGLTNGGTIVLCHDVHETTVRVLAQKMVDDLNARGLRSVPVGECLGDAPQNWYRTAR